MQATAPSAPLSRAPRWTWPVAILSALFLANAVPHTLAGPLILNLPTPFSGGPGTLSNPMVNVLWGLANIAIGWALLTRVRPWLDRPALRWSMIASAAAFFVFLTWAIGSLPLPNRFG
ncbi:MAG: hypothetical protein ABIQ30_02690 [Devosia sp.]